RRRRADPGQTEQLRDARDDRHGTVGGDRQHAVHRVTATDLGDGVGVREVDGYRVVGKREAGRLAIPVDGDDADAELADALDRTALVAPRADEQNGPYRAMLVARAQRVVHERDDRFDIRVVPAGDAQCESVDHHR